MAASPCPNREQLQGVILGLLPEADSEQIEQHLFECQRCVDTLAELGAGDTLVEAIKAQPSMALELAGYKEQVEAILGRWKTPRQVEFDPTPPVSSAEEPTSDASPRGTADDVEESLRLLSPAQAPDELGRLGQYRILRVLGSGGMGIVFEAEDPQLKRRVALKAMKPAVAASASSRKRFLREAQAAASVEHDHIVAIHQVGEDCGVPFIAMPFLRGGTLAERLTAALPVSEVIRIGREIATGLDVAHRAGLIHRDIKPGNIWLEAATGRVKILDFGLARAASTDEHLTHTGALLGTPSYMAPEQGRSEEIDARADLFSLGCVLYQMATGVRPFVGHDALSTLLAVTTRDPLPPRELNPELPSGLSELIVSLLSKNPAGRPQTAGEVAETLEQIGNAWQHGELEAPATPVFTASAESTSRPAAQPPRRRRPALLAATAGAFLLLAAIVFYVQTKDGRIRLEIDDPEIEVAIKGTSIVFKQADNGSDVKVSPGEKTLVIERGDFTFETDRLVLKRGDTAIVSVTLLADEIEVKHGDKVIGHEKLTGGWYSWPKDAPAPAIAPFHAAQAKKHQQEWADYLKLPLEYTNSIGMKFVLIPPGEFMMGGTAEEIEEAHKAGGAGKEAWDECIKSEAPRHRVALTRPFYLAIHEVTQKDYEAVMGKNPSYFAKTGPDEKVRQKIADLDTENFPVECASWNDAAEFCANLSKREEVKPSSFRTDETVTPLKGTGYRLPTEAEWEFACRAGTLTRFSIGEQENELISAGWHTTNSGARTHAVGELASNPFGLFDTHGNVWEWVEEAWRPSFYATFAERAAINPNYPFSAGSQRVMKGGAWADVASYSRSATRFAYHPTYRYNSIGFRVALAADSLGGKSLAEEQRHAPPTSAQGSPSRSVPAGDPNAEIVKWVFDIGGQQAFTVRGQTHLVKSPSERPDSIPEGPGPDDLSAPNWWTINLTDRQTVTDADLKPLRTVTKPLRLFLSGTKVTDVGLAELHDMPTLAQLFLFDTRVTGAGIARLGTLPNLSLIELGHTATSDADLSLLAHFPKLRRVGLSSPHLSAQGIKTLSTLPIEYIDLSDIAGDADAEGVGKLHHLLGLQAYNVANFNDACLEHLKDMSNLRVLGLYGTAVTDVGVARLPAFSPQLHTLNLCGTNITDAALKHLARLNSLNQLDIRSTKVTSAGVVELRAALPNCGVQWSPRFPAPSGDPGRDAAEWALATGGAVGVLLPGATDPVVVSHSSELPAGSWQLSSLEIGGIFVVGGEIAPGVAPLATVPTLNGIEFNNCGFDVGALPLICTLPRLSRLTIRSSPMDDAHIAQLANMPKLATLHLERCELTDRGLEQIGGLRWLRDLYLIDNPGISNEGIAHLRRLRGLRTLMLDGSGGIGDGAAEHLSGLKQLKVLSLRRSALSDSGLAALGDLTNLTELYVESTRVTDNGLTVLGNLRQLKKLDIGRNLITDVGMSEIAKCTGLDKLSMREARVGDAGIQKLRELGRLKELYLDETELTDEGMKHLHHLKNLTVLDVRGTQVTATSVADVQAALANCKIEWTNPKSSMPTTDPNVELFNWVNAVGGQQLFFVGGTIKDVKQANEIRDLLPDGPYDVADFQQISTLWYINLSDCRDVTDDDLKRFKSITKPLHLDLIRTSITDSGLAGFGALPNLLVLSLLHTSITRHGLENLALPNLGVLLLPEGTTTDGDLTVLTRFPKLQWVAFQAAGLTNRGADALAMLPSLVRLDAAHLGKAECERVASLKQLKTFSTFGKEFDDECLDSLSKLPKLTALHLQGTSISDGGIARLPLGMPRVQSLILTRTQLTDAACSHLAMMPDLWHLELYETKVTVKGITELQAALPKCKIYWQPELPPPTGDHDRDAAVWVLATGGEVGVLPRGANSPVIARRLSDLPADPWQLNTMDLHGLGVHNGHFVLLANLPGLSAVRISDCTISGAALTHLRSLPKLALLHVGGCGLTDAALEPVSQLSWLRELYLYDNPGISDKGLAHLTQLRGLFKLGLRGATITDAGMEHVRRLKQLKFLNLSQTAVGDRGLAALARLEALTELHLAVTRTSDEGLAAINNLGKLKSLDVSGTIVTDAGLAEIAKLSTLEWLKVAETRVGDDGLKYLHALANLKHLDLTSTHVTAAGVAALQAARPGCEIIHDGK